MNNPDTPPHADPTLHAWLTGSGFCEAPPAVLAWSPDAGSFQTTELEHNPARVFGEPGQNAASQPFVA